MRSSPDTNGSALDAHNAALPVYHFRQEINLDTRNYWFLGRRNREAEVVLVTWCIPRTFTLLGATA
jgi:hypothetical protein